jgi:class 3 adenylate cyclase
MNTGGRVRAERRLAAILAADVAGYSRLIGADEEGTLDRIRSIRAEVIDPKIAAHHGRLVKTTGDGLLVEFGSVVDALRCATEVQQAMAERNAGDRCQPPPHPSRRRTLAARHRHIARLVTYDMPNFTKNKGRRSFSVYGN